MKNIVFKAFLPLLMIAFFTGCKTVKTVKPTTPVAKVPSKTEELMSTVKKQQFQFSNLYVKMNADLNMKGNDVSSKIELKMLRDSIIQLSVQPMFGVEIFRLALTKDSVKLIDRLNKRYAVESYTQMKNENAVVFNFYNLQSLLVNRIFFPGEKTVSEALYDRFHLTSKGATSELSVKDASGVQYVFKADAQGKLLSSIMSMTKNLSTLQWIYSDFHTQGNQLFPSIMNVSYTHNGTTAVKAQLNYAKISPNTILNLSFSIPEKYKRVSLMDILRQYSGMK